MGQVCPGGGRWVGWGDTEPHSTGGETEAKKGERHF